MSHRPNAFATLRRSLERPISAARLDGYRPSGGDDRDILVNYFWNIALCEALYPALDTLEVSLRNSIHAAATVIYGTEYWFDRRGLLLERRRHPEAIAAARKTLSNYRRQQTPGRIVAELRFGFWTSLLTGHYEQHLWRPNNYALLRMSFSNMPYKIRTRKRVHERYNSIRLLRNRVFHFEPILNHPDLKRAHAEILEAIGWVSPTLRDSIALFDRFPTVYQNERQQIQDKLEDWLASA